MIPYIALIVYLVLLTVVFKVELKNNRTLYVILAFLGLFVLYGLRDAYSIGIDSSSSYYYLFVTSKDKLFDISETNFLFYFLLRFSAIVFKGNYQYFITLSALFVSYAYCRIILKYSVKPFLSIMWFIGMMFYIFMFSALKQATAMAVLTLAFDAMMQKKHLKFYLLVILASFFHVPALIFLPAYLISRIRIGRAYIIFIVSMFVVVFFFRTQILEIMMIFYESTEELDMVDTTFIGGRVIAMIFVMIIAYIMRNPTQDNRLYNTLMMFLGISAMLQTFCYYNNIFERLANYYFQFSILLIPLIFERGKKIKSVLNPKIKKIAFIIGPSVITCFSIWYFFNFLINDPFASYFVPYKFFWQ